MPLVLCVPWRRFASCQFTMRARMSLRTATPNTSSARSISPTSWLSRFLTDSFMLFVPGLGAALGRSLGCGSGGADRGRERQPVRRLPLDRVLEHDDAALVARHRTQDHDEPARRIGGDDLQVLGGHPLMSQVAGHLLVF